MNVRGNDGLLLKKGSDILFDSYIESMPAGVGGTSRLRFMFIFSSTHVSIQEVKFPAVFAVFICLCLFFSTKAVF